jgi:hypothetical protein
MENIILIKLNTTSLMVLEKLPDEDKDDEGSLFPKKLSSKSLVINRFKSSYYKSLILI